MWRLGALGLGLWVGLVGALVHRQDVQAAGITWPWGLVAVLATIAVVARAVASWRRLAAAWFALGWAGVLLAQQWLPAGGYLVAADAYGWAFTVGGVMAIAAAMVRLPRIAA